MGIFYRAHHVYYRAACRAGKGAGGCADSGKTIYTEFKDGNSTHSGDGSYGNPYNLFEDAYAAAGNGDEISILGSGAF